MGIKDLQRERLSLDDILAELDEPVRGVLLKALRTRKKNGTSRFFEVSATEIERACADDGYHIPAIEISEWRRTNAD